MPCINYFGTKIHCVEMLPGAGAKIARSAGSEVRLISIDGGQASRKCQAEKFVW